MHWLDEGSDARKGTCSISRSVQAELNGGMVYDTVSCTCLSTLLRLGLRFVAVYIRYIIIDIMSYLTWRSSLSVHPLVMVGGLRYIYCCEA